MSVVGSNSSKRPPIHTSDKALHDLGWSTAFLILVMLFIIALITLVALFGDPASVEPYQSPMM